MVNDLEKIAIIDLGSAKGDVRYDGFYLNKVSELDLYNLTILAGELAPLYPL